MNAYSYIRENLAAVKETLAELAARRASPPPTLVAVTKSATDEELLALAALGARDMAENRPQELVRRKQLLDAAGYDVRMHEIGHLQSNKVKSILPLTYMIHSLSSLSLAEEIERRAAALSLRIPVLLEINSAKEDSKSGIYPEDALAFYERVRLLPHLAVCGVMTMGPACDEEEIRPYFRLTKNIYDSIGERYGYETETPVLSMGMSDSLRTAVEEGSTLVRIGRRLFVHTKGEISHV